MMAMMACHTEIPVATRDPPSCQLERAIWLIAQNDMKLLSIVSHSRIKQARLQRIDLRPASPGTPVRR
jgi:hypothetical protein